MHSYHKALSQGTVPISPTAGMRLCYDTDINEKACPCRAATVAYAYPGFQQTSGFGSQQQQGFGSVHFGPIASLGLGVPVTGFAITLAPNNYCCSSKQRNLQVLARSLPIIKILSRSR
ncbi:MAG: hypothetical protein WB988_00655 [Candidatus Nitrosopolaris sp.]|jgi:hypothetical protein